MAKKDKLSIYLSFLLRHGPDTISLEMDEHGWVSVESLIEKVNGTGKYKIDRATLEAIVAADEKGRYRFDETGVRVKACQGHSVSWVKPELEYVEPPQYIYHGTNTAAWEKIMESKAILKMGRHAVHMHADPQMAWKSATRWKMIPVLLKIDAQAMYRDGFVLGRTENEVWCVNQVPVAYVVDIILSKDRF